MINIEKYVVLWRLSYRESLRDTFNKTNEEILLIKLMKRYF